MKRSTVPATDADAAAPVTSEPAPVCSPATDGRPGFALCGVAPREVRAWGVPPREPVPAARCPMRARVVGERVVAEPITSVVDPLPFEPCGAKDPRHGARRVLRVDGGWFVARDSVFASNLSWYSEDGALTRTLLAARVAGLVRAPSGDVLALAIGRAHLGKGAILRFSRQEDTWRPRFVAILPIEPSAVALDDGGTLVGYADRFLFRVDEGGKLENLHYLSRDVGRVWSIARSPEGAYYLGLECGVLQLTRAGGRGFREAWWSARDGASGRWRECPG